ncbi:carboxymuconolactone decarboxylase family protein [Nocardia asteroides]|uniref:carboxymuconolactone decarboxylase family protein n=1 Tax=Nocardia asteroides TaxID=1824 RepID=UPI001E352D18|nr:carboxymuconolactone decarboxylase family protein [Nocardia asteroides]UGT57715.1 carboxymuconolactone decarboxylase family protein [Nocardia asteroides]
MRVVERVRGYAGAVKRARRNRGELVGWLGRRPQIGAATVAYETALLFSNRLDPRLKELAELKTAGLVGCQFCLDIGSALAHTAGLTREQITDLGRYRTSDAYSELEKTVIAFAEAMTVTPAIELEELRAELLTHLSKAQLMELAATIAWENQRARLNQGLGVSPTGMADGLTCAMPEPRRA